MYKSFGDVVLALRREIYSQDILGSSQYADGSEPWFLIKMLMEEYVGKRA